MRRAIVASVVLLLFAGCGSRVVNLEKTTPAVGTVAYRSMRLQVPAGYEARLIESAGRKASIRIARPGMGKNEYSVSIVTEAVVGNYGEERGPKLLKNETIGGVHCFSYGTEPIGTVLYYVFSPTPLDNVLIYSHPPETNAAALTREIVNSIRFK